MIHYETLLLQAINAAVLAGAEILNVYHNDDFEVELKSDNSPLTRADRLADQCIAKNLEQTNIPILSEEAGHHDFATRSQWDLFWLVDPLDGTREFISRNDEFTVNIALIKENAPTLGVIYLPVKGTLYFAETGLGAWKTNKIAPEYIPAKSLEGLTSVAQKLPQVNSASQSAVVSRSHLSEATIEFLHHIESVTGKLEHVSSGSSLKLCRIAEGSAGIYPRLGRTMEWDIAAGTAIVQATGGVVLSHDGSPVTFNKQDLGNPWFVALSAGFKKEFPRLPDKMPEWIGYSSL